MTRRARLTLLLIALTTVLCWRLGQSFPITLCALVVAYGLALTIDEYKPFDRIARIQKTKKEQLTWK